MDDLIREACLELIRLEGPIRARRIASLLRAKGHEVDRREVNQFLYGLTSFVSKDEDHKWSVKS